MTRAVSSTPTRCYRAVALRDPFALLCRGSPDGGTAIVFEELERRREGDLAASSTPRPGEVLNEGHLGLRAYSAAFSPDGEHVAVTGNSGEVVTIDVSSESVTRSPATGHAAGATGSAGPRTALGSSPARTTAV